MSLLWGGEQDFLLCFNTCGCHPPAAGNLLEMQSLGIPLNLLTQKRKPSPGGGGGLQFGNQ